jgi:hypothetical protein
MGYIVQSIVFDKNKGWNIKTARKWIKDHKEFSEPIKVDETTNTFRFRLIPPKKAEQMGFTDYRMKTLASGDVGIMLDIAYNKLKGGDGIGGSLANEDLQALLAKSYSKNPEDYKDFKVDKSLSGQRVQVYHNPTTQQTIVAHRGTSSIPNWIENVAYAVSNDKSGKAFQHSKKIQDQAYQKYGKENITTIGHSKGALHAQEYGKEGKEVITLNKPVNITDALFTRVPKSQTDIRTQYDPVSFLRPFQRGSKVETIKSTTKNPLAEHKTSVLGRLDPRRLFGSSMMCPYCGVNCCCGMMRGGMIEEEEDVGVINNIIDIETEPYNEQIQELRYSLLGRQNRLRSLGYMSRGTNERNEIQQQITLLREQIGKIEKERDDLIEDIKSQKLMERLRNREIKKGRGMMRGGVIQNVQFNDFIIPLNMSSGNNFINSFLSWYLNSDEDRADRYMDVMNRNDIIVENDDGEEFTLPEFLQEIQGSEFQGFIDDFEYVRNTMTGNNQELIEGLIMSLMDIVDETIQSGEGEIEEFDYLLPDPNMNIVSDEEDEEEQGAGMCGGAGLTPLSMAQFQEFVNATTSQNVLNNWTKFQKFIQKYGGNTDVIRQRLVLFLNLPPYVGAETERDILREFDLYVNYGQEENEGAGRNKKTKAKKGKN